jgi:predicted ATP-dependent serine protease
MNALRIYIFQVTKDGRFRGTNEFEHLVDCVLKAENGTITSKGCKNRFGGNGSVKVF